MLANLLHLRLQPYTTVFKAIQSYKGSPAQKHLHSYVRDNNQFNEMKKGIDYETVNKNSKGRFMIREFVFQQKVEQNYVRPLDCYLLPLGKWTREEIKQLKVGPNKTASEMDNEVIISTCAPALQSIFKEYYDKSGKRGYKFILSQQIGKISSMSAQQFDSFVKVLGGDTQQILKKLAKIQR